ncbi:DUF1365 domain-containing protein [Asticcacaulis sp. ZE23SCel15]|uniref:DUF1365 domain-containing protein n=1 Tax=Asticcacaulis sp. ZE23SCel15 TaxID=3059027 RepID=UPI00265E4A25|nr:DUF1365 domain-containing protein [Asticcacaulis sp. ZE23SCel15]WKL55929.1 DUF1365 domain-containing protein [Asticcacaulis sp. ZE23SCel15]
MNAPFPAPAEHKINRPDALAVGLYAGDVLHVRYAPKSHRLSYKVFQVLLDLDHLDADLKPLKWLSLNRFGWLSFHEADHGPDQDDTTRPLKDRVVRHLKSRDMYQGGDRLFLLTMPRVLGYVFNPISLYFVQAPDGQIRSVVYEVNNTFGDRHSYVLPVEPHTRHIHQRSAKRLHVSPFMDMDMSYDFDLTAPDETFALKIMLRQKGENMLLAAFTAKREALSDKALMQQFLALPLMTLGVMAGIHWEALKIWLKGITYRPKPPTAKSSASVG